MPYPVGHRAETKTKIIQSARRLFNVHGFENVSITQIMGGAGLTHGAFYSYFNSKSDQNQDSSKKEVDNLHRLGVACLPHGAGRYIQEPY